MDVGEMSRKIEEEEARYQELLKEMEGLVPSIVAAVVADVAEWSRVAAKNAAEAYFTNNPKRHEELAAKLPKLKAAIDAMLVRLPSLVERELERLNSWAHRKCEAAMMDPPWTVREATSDTWWKVARTAYGFIAQPLAEHGFLGISSREGNLWVANSKHHGSYTLAFGGDLKAMPQGVQVALRPYYARWEEVRQRRHAVAVLEKERAKTTFANSWGK